MREHRVLKAHDQVVVTVNIEVESADGSITATGHADLVNPDQSQIASAVAKLARGAVTKMTAAVTS